ncbi:hypothetical protein BDQ17DRAFT_1502501 [Cyathus striatus]|nr:hypothetical protein BDQ17DRAFT_1502501 [Cyathus striatus]
MPEAWKLENSVLDFGNEGPNITSDSEWDILFPANRGVVHLMTNTEDEYVVSMYQQLHCLDVLRVAYVNLHTIHLTQENPILLTPTCA